MILYFSNLPVPATWKRIAARGDDSFVCSAREDELKQGGTPLNLLNLDAGEFGTLLKMKGPVTPHTDDYIGRLDAVERDGSPQNELSVFWLTKLPASARHNEFWLQCGTEYCQMVEGDFVIFPHSVTHAVITLASWEGISWQLSAYENVPNIEKLAQKLPPSVAALRT